jgi:predicted transposase YbfD/YdcC
MSKQLANPEFLFRFEGVNDPRLMRKQLYPMNEILFLCINAVLCGYEDWGEIADFGKAKLSWFRKYLPYKNGICSHDTVNRVMGLIDYREFEVFFVSWVESLIGVLGGKMIHIDGKVLRASVEKKLQQTSKSEGGKSAIHLVEAWSSELNFCIGQYKTEDKSNEITAIPALLDMLDIVGCLISIDALGCQKTIASKIINKESDYLFGLKGNQEHLHKAVKELFESPEIDTEVHETAEINRGRFEVRHCRVLSAKLLDTKLLNEWAGLATLIEIEAHRGILKKDDDYSVEYRYYISSKVGSPEFFNKAVRAHWAIENNLHWSMDVQFDEDKSQKQSKNSPQNFALIRRMALNMLKNNGEDSKISINRRKNKCTLSDEYRSSTIRF